MPLGKDRLRALFDDLDVGRKQRVDIEMAVLLITYWHQGQGSRQQANKGVDGAAVRGVNASSEFRSGSGGGGGGEDGDRGGGVSLAVHPMIGNRPLQQALATMIRRKDEFLRVCEQLDGGGSVRPMLRCGANTPAQRQSQARARARARARAPFATPAL